MYTNDKANRITVRLNDEQAEFLRSTAEFIGTTPSEFLRMVITASMNTQKEIEKRALTEKEE